MMRCPSTEWGTLRPINGVEIVVERLIAGPATVRALAGVLSETERERADRFVFERDRRRFVVCRARLRELLAERLHCSPASVEIVYGAHGKPGLRPHQEGTDLRFNVSHCDDLAVYGFSSGREIGVDVEAVRALSDAHDIAAGFFSGASTRRTRQSPIRTSRRRSSTAGPARRPTSRRSERGSLTPSTASTCHSPLTSQRESSALPVSLASCVGGPSTAFPPSRASSLPWS